MAANTCVELAEVGGGQVMGIFAARALGVSISWALDAFSRSVTRARAHVPLALIAF